VENGCKYGRLAGGRWGIGAAEGVEDGEQWRGDEDSPGRDEDAEDDGAEERRPPGDAGGAVQDVGADDEAFEDGDEGVEAEDEAEVPAVGVIGKGDGEDGADEGEHAAEAGDELEEGGEDGPEGSERDAEDLETDEPEGGYDEGVEGDGAAPVEEGAAGGADVGLLGAGIEPGKVWPGGGGMGGGGGGLRGSRSGMLVIWMRRWLRAE
jgi:hypothetical protein